MPKTYFVKAGPFPRKQFTMENGDGQKVAQGSEQIPETPRPGITEGALERDLISLSEGEEETTSTRVPVPEDVQDSEASPSEILHKFDVQEEEGSSRFQGVHIRGEQILSPTGKIISQDGGSAFNKVCDFLFGTGRASYPGLVRPADVFEAINKLGYRKAIERFGGEVVPKTTEEQEWRYS